MVCLCFQLANAQNAIKEIPSDTTYNPSAAWKNLSRNYPEIKIAEADLSSLKVDRDLVYATLKNTQFGDRDLHLDVIRPLKDGKYPALFMIHGGGWRSGNKLMEHPMAAYVAAHGYVAIPVEYRLSPEAKYPNAVYDIKAAIRWIKANAEEFSVDTTRIAIEGNSAGGQLATLVGMTNRIAQFEGNEGVLSKSSSVHAVVDVDGVVDFMAPSSLNLPRYPDWLGGSFTEKPAVWKDASPIFWVNKESVPIAFIISAQPKYTAGMAEMLDLYDQHGIYWEKHKLPESPHAFWLFHPWFEPTVKYMVGFLDKVLK